MSTAPKSECFTLGEADIQAREADILGSPPRIAPLSVDQLDDDARAMAIKLRESAGKTDHSSIPDIFGTMMKHPPLYWCQMALGTMLFNGTIPKLERELAILLVGWLCRAPYEWGQHVEIAKRYGMAADVIERVTQGSSAAGWSEHEAAILRGVEELLQNQMITDATWDTLARSWSEQQLIEFPSMVGQYVATAYSQNSLRMRLNPENRGLRHR
jgi:4-carboxymuconolactone decarboxylase